MENSKNKDLNEKISLPNGIDNRKLSFENLKDKLFSSIDKAQFHIYLYALIIVFAYIFYNFGYAFIYAYYFASSSNKYYALDLLIDKIPFDFKLIALVGAIILIFLISFISPILMFFYEKSSKRKLLWLMMHLTSAIIIFMIYYFASGTEAKGDTYLVFCGLLLKTSAISLFIISLYKPILSSSISIVNSIKNNYRKLILNICYLALIVWANISFLNNLSELDLDSNKALIIVLLSIEGILLFTIYELVFNGEHKFTKFKNKLIKLLYDYGIYPCGISFLILAKNDRKIIFAVFIFIIFFEYIQKKYLSKKNFGLKISKKGRIESEAFEKINNKRDVNERMSKNIFKYLVLLSFGLFIVFFFIFMQNTIFRIGEKIGDISILNTTSKITYYVEDSLKSEKTIEGVIVAHKDDEYFISTPDREQVIIKTSGTVFITKKK